MRGAVALNTSMSKDGGVGEESQQNEEDNYEAETFEYEDKGHLPVVTQPQVLHHYMQPT